MKRKKMRLSLGKLTVADLINVATCIPDPEGCNPADTYGARTICP